MTQQTSGIVIQTTRARPPRGGGKVLRSRAHTMMLCSCLVLVALAPLPLGSVRPLLWGVWSTYLGLVLTGYGLLLLRSGEKPRIGLREIGLPAVLFALTLLWILVQVLPFGSLVGGFAIEGVFGFVSRTDAISIDPASTVLMLLRQASYGALFFFVLQVAVNPGRREIALWAALVSCLVYALLGIFALQTGDWILGVQKWAYQGSATGPFVNRNSFATYLAFGCVLASAQLARHVRARYDRQYVDGGPIPHNVSSLLLYTLAILFLFSVIVASQSRMGLAAAALGTTAVFIFTALRSRRAVRSIAAGMVLIVLLAVAAFNLFGAGIFNRFETVDASASVRLELYHQVLQLIDLRPLIGFGGGTFELAFPLVHQMPVSVDLNWSKAHNSYLTLWSELGLVAGSLPILAIALIGWRCSIRRGTGDDDTRYGSIAIGATAVAAIHSLADFSLEIQANAYVFVFLLALGFPTRSKTTRQ